MEYENTIRQEVVRNAPNVRKLMLSNQQYKLWKMIFARGGYYSDDIAKMYNISVACASGRLKTLMDKGYLFREKVTDNTGGIKYLYKAISRFLN